MLRAIKPIYDGSEDELMSFLTRVDIRCPSLATYITINGRKLDLTYKFAHITEADILQIVQAQWTSPTVETDKHTIGHCTCSSRLLAKCLMNSITPDLSFIIINCISLAYQNDGTYILWLLSNNIHHNNVAFIKHIREKVMVATLDQFQHDVEKYIIYIKNNLRMITPTSTTAEQHSDLITYIMHQLKHTKNSTFQHYIQDVHIQYQEAKLPRYTPTKLLLDIEEKIRVLKHTEVWDISEQPDTPAVALNITPNMTTQLKDFLTNHISSEFNKLIEHHKLSPQGGRPKGKFQHQEWMFLPPKHPSDTKMLNGRNYNWCLKCNKGKGQWVQAHATDTHLDDFRPQRRTSNNNNRPPPAGILKNGSQLAKDKHISFSTHDQTNTPAPPIEQSVQLSLSEGLENCFHFDVDDVADDE
jgi:hypothetical protein